MLAESTLGLQAAPETGDAVEKNIRDSAKAVKEQAPKAAEQASQVCCPACLRTERRI